MHEEKSRWRSLGDMACAPAYSADVHYIRECILKGQKVDWSRVNNIRPQPTVHSGWWQWGSKVVFNFFGTLRGYRDATFDSIAAVSILEEFIPLLLSYLKKQDVSEIVLLIDSSGGELHGLLEAADVIFEAKKFKPIFSLVREANSGAYLLASATSRILLASETTSVGSIGLISRIGPPPLAEGFEEYEVGKFKTAEYKDGEPTDEEVKAYIDARRQAKYYAIIDAVARYRGRTPAEIELVAEGKSFMGRRAINVGLADAFFDPMSWHFSGNIVELNGKEVI